MSEELRKQKLKKASKDYLDRVSRPFNLTKSRSFEGGSLRERRHSYSEGQAAQQDGSAVDFVAQPLPEFYYADEELNEKYLFFLLNREMNLFDFSKDLRINITQVLDKMILRISIKHYLF